MILDCINCKKKFYKSNENSELEGQLIECKYCNQKWLYVSETKYPENNLTVLNKDIDHIEKKMSLKKNEFENKKIQLSESSDSKKNFFDMNQLQLKTIKNHQLSTNQEKDNNVLKELQKKIKELDEANNKIKFYQDDNVRLSSEMNDIKNKYEIIKDNFNKTEKEKNDIFNQIQELNNSLLKNNIIGSPFLTNKIEEVNINSKILNDITDNNLKNAKNSETGNDLNVLVKDIFK
jgi:DNA-directed RNA polymerase subunit RPC12/RpoP